MAKHLIEKSFKVPNGQSFSCSYSNGSKFLASLCDKYGSDKGSLRSSDHVYDWEPHNYTDVYAMLFDHCRQHVKSVFECGIGTNDPEKASSMGETGKPGASLRVWRDYFPNASIIGGDIDASAMVREDRISSFLLDQTNIDQVALTREILRIRVVPNIDLFIDDGLHTFNAGVTLFEGMIDIVTGVYSIEDVQQDDFEKYVEYFESKPQYSASYFNLYRKKEVFTEKSLKEGKLLKDNNMIIVRKQCEF